MAATVSSPWGKPGAWALDAEEHEAELQKESEKPQEESTFVAEPLGGAAEFPSLAAAAATKQPKKKKNQTLSLAEFSNYSSPKASPEPDLFNLPTRPRERSAEELERSRLGGGFKSYGLNYRNGGDESNSRWGGGGNGNSRVSNRDSSREYMPSRADEIDDWSKTKKSLGGSGYERREREWGSSFFDSQSKADESASWVANKPAYEGPRRFGGGSNGGFERRGSFDSLSRERHGFNSGGGGGGGAADFADNWGRKKEESFSGGSERPKLKLQPRTLPVSNGNEGAAKPKGSNPFGDARPREEVLKEKGMDYKEIDEKLEAVKISGEKNKEVERGDSSGRRVLGIGRGGAPDSERRWRKSDATDSGSRPQSAETTEIGDTDENEPATEAEVA